MRRLLDVFRNLSYLRARKRVHEHRYQSDMMTARVALVRAHRRKLLRMEQRQL